MKDIKGNRYGRLTAIEHTDRSSYGSVIWKFKCDCGEIVYRSLRSVSYSSNRKSKISCGCHITSITAERYQYLVGIRHGKLIAISVRFYKSEGLTMVRCRCDCGEHILVRPGDFERRKYTSCSPECRWYRPKLPYGESSARHIYSTYNNYATKNGLSWNIPYKKFLEITKLPCDHCGAHPSTVWQSEIDKGSNGVYTHNKIAYIDPDLGYTIGNIAIVCTSCINIYRIDHRISSDVT